MNAHTLRTFDVELESLRSRALKMGGLVEQQFARAMEGLYVGNCFQLEAVIRDHARVNEMEKELDLACSQMIAGHEPMALDLRMIVAVLKSIAELQRIGEKARKIARLGIALHERPATGPEIALGYGAEQSLRMLRGSLDAFSRLDVDLAAATMQLDARVDSECAAITQQIGKHMREDRQDIPSLIDLHAIASAIEGIGDHARNIAQHVVHTVEGYGARYAPTLASAGVAA